MKKHYCKIGLYNQIDLISNPKLGLHNKSSAISSIFHIRIGVNTAMIHVLEQRLIIELHKVVQCGFRDVLTCHLWVFCFVWFVWTHLLHWPVGLFQFHVKWITPEPPLFHLLKPAVLLFAPCPSLIMYLFLQPECRTCPTQRILSLLSYSSIHPAPIATTCVSKINNHDVVSFLICICYPWSSISELTDRLMGWLIQVLLVFVAHCWTGKEIWTPVTEGQFLTH